MAVKGKSQVPAAGYLSRKAETQLLPFSLGIEECRGFCFVLVRGGERERG